jgi:hypothetical protein
MNRTELPNLVLTPMIADDIQGASRFRRWDERVKGQTLAALEKLQREKEQRELSRSDPIRTNDSSQRDALEYTARHGELSHKDPLSPASIAPAAGSISEPSKLRSRKIHMNTETNWRIAKSIKLPTGESGRTRISYPFELLEVGHSFEAPLKARSTVVMKNKKNPSVQYEWRHWDKKKKTIRVWRTK